MPSLIDFVDKKKGFRSVYKTHNNGLTSDNPDQEYTDDLNDIRNYNDSIVDVIGSRDDDYNSAYDDFDVNYSFGALSQATAILDQSNIELQEIYSQLIWSRQECDKIASTMAEKETEFLEVKDTLEFRVKELELEVERDDLMRQLNHMNLYGIIPAEILGSTVIDGSKPSSALKHQLEQPAVTSSTPSSNDVPAPLIELKDLFPKPKQKLMKNPCQLNSTSFNANINNISISSSINSIDGINNDIYSNSCNSNNIVDFHTSTTATEPLILPPGFISPFFHNSHNSNINNNNNNNDGTTLSSAPIPTLMPSESASHGNTAGDVYQMSGKEEHKADEFLTHLEQFNWLQSTLLQQLALLQAQSHSSTSYLMLQPVETQVASIVSNINAMIAAMESAGTFTQNSHIDNNSNEYLNGKETTHVLEKPLYNSDRHQVEQVMENMLSIVLDRVESSYPRTKESLQPIKSNETSSSVTNSSARSTARVSAPSVTRGSDGQQQPCFKLSLRPFADAMRQRPHIIFPSSSSSAVGVDDMGSVDASGAINEESCSVEDSFTTNVNNNKDGSIGIKLLYHGLWSLRRPRSMGNNNIVSITTPSKQQQHSHSLESSNFVPAPITFYAPQPQLHSSPPHIVTSPSSSSLSSRIQTKHKQCLTDPISNLGNEIMISSSPLANDPGHTVIDSGDWRRLVDEAYRNISLNRISSSSISNNSVKCRHRPSKLMPSTTEASHDPPSSSTFVQHPPSQPKPSLIDTRPNRRNIISATDSNPAVMTNMTNSLSSLPPSCNGNGKSSTHQTYKSSKVHILTAALISSPSCHRRIKSPLRHGEFDTRLSTKTSLATATTNNSNNQSQSLPLNQHQHDDYMYNNVRGTVYDGNNDDNDDTNNSPDLHSWRIAHPRRLPLTEPPATLKYARFKNKYSSHTRASVKPAGVGKLPRGFRSARTQDLGLEQLYNRVLYTQQQLHRDGEYYNNNDEVGSTSYPKLSSLASTTTATGNQGLVEESRVMIERPPLVATLLSVDTDLRQARTMLNTKEDQNRLENLSNIPSSS